MKIKLDIKNVKSYREEAIANYLKIMIDDFMFLLEALDKLDEIEEDQEEEE